MACAEQLMKYTSLADKCEVARTEPCQGNFVDFVALHYCTFEGNLFYSMSIILLSVSLSFYIVTKAANNYLSNGITGLSRNLGLSQNLAGVTLVAFGNGAPDVICSVLASGDSSDGLTFPLSTLLGGTISVSILAFSLVVYVGEGIKVKKALFIRDCCFFIFAMLVLLVYMIIGKITFTMAVLFFSIYILFIVYVIWQNKKKKVVVPKQVTECLSDPEDEIVHPEDTLNLNITDDYVKMPENKKKPLKKFETQSSMSSTLNRTYEKVVASMRKHYFYHSETMFHQMGLFRKVIYILVDFPIDFLQSITIPPCEKEQWNNRIVVLMPWFSVIFFILVQKWFNLFTDYLFLGIACPILLLCSVGLYFMTYRGRLPKQKKLLYCLSILMAIIWIWSTTDNLVNSVQVTA